MLSQMPVLSRASPRLGSGRGTARKRQIGMYDPAALRRRGTIYKNRGDYQSAYEYFSRAAELGDADAHYELGYLYYHGEGGIEKDVLTKAVHFFERAAIAGHPDARCYLGAIELRFRGELERAITHWMIAAQQGDIHALNNLKGLYKDNLFSRKDELAIALRGYQAAIDAMKSPQREAAASRYREGFVNVIKRASNS